ncbi:MAG: cation diffusion facilitator family transporter [Actinomycetaceae bacterium]|nr:cation diffusion facilitator family transporter [Actinomycetaceae bacterium]
MSLSHDHGHSHGHPAETPAPGSARRRLALTFALSASIVVAQAIGSWITGSLALLTDTAHAIADTSGLLAALVASVLVTRPESPKRTWGFRRIEVIAALGQATLLLTVGIYAVVEGIARLASPPEVPSVELLVFGILGLIANVAGIAILYSGRDTNFNMRAAFLEVLNDALGSFGVITAAIVVATTGFQGADAIAALFIAVLILPRAAFLMRETFDVLMEYTPKGLDLNAVRDHILALDHVRDVHDLHASTVATGLPTLTGHVVVDDECFRDGHAARTLEKIKECVAEHFEVSIRHSTFQIETQSISSSEPEPFKHA